MDKAQLQGWIKGQYEALNMTEAERAEARAEMATLARKSNGATMRDLRDTFDGVVFEPRREAKMHAEIAARYEARTRVVAVVRTAAEQAAADQEAVDAMLKAVNGWLESSKRAARKTAKKAA